MDKNQLATYAAGVVAVGVVLAALGVQFTALVPYAVLLACPLMMIFMMRGMHGSHGQHEDHTGHGCEHDPTHPAEPPSRQA